MGEDLQTDFPSARKPRNLEVTFKHLGRGSLNPRQAEKERRPPAVSKSMENERTATTKAKEGRVEKEVEERRSQREQQIQEGNLDGNLDGAVSSLPYTVSPVAIRTGGKPINGSIIGNEITYRASTLYW
ncbi:hypothetical protein N7449_011981 [Penicillium cf. viridicatum]|uniref:Uncharacterized protein n=1 Tax=Penicillium cf. viridicatum TaxID=2972119 RepID=A0A9W9IPY5_9EURO|nr:hypothetical protein N7449_011981 [Penicillium cf. viridicatum]